jgi:uncharacterized protein with HEPN domain
MRKSAFKIKEYTRGLTYEDFINDEKTIDAVIRDFEIIGEASNRVDSSFRSFYLQLPCDRIRGFRNCIIHEYFGIDYLIVWTIIENDLEELIDQIDEILKDRDL